MARWFATLLAAIGCAIAAVAFSAFANPAEAPTDPFMQARAAYDRGDFGMAREQFRVLADNGQPKAQTMMGHIYFAPRAVRQNIVVADDWYGRAAANNEPNGQYMHAVLGVSDMWFSMQGIKREPMDTAVALDLMRKAASQGLTEAILFMSDVLADDDIAPRPPMRSLRKLSFVGLRLDGVAKNEAESVMWLRTAAGQGDPYAQEMLGLRYAKGVSKDKSEAYFWLSLAARRPEPPDDVALDMLGLGKEAYEELIKQRNRARSSLTRTERTTVEERLAAWQPKPAPDFGTDLYTPAERVQMANPPGIGIRSSGR